MADESMPDLGSLLGMAMEMQQQMADAQAALTSTVVEGSAGGEAVRISVTGGYEFRSVRISPDVVDPDDVDLLADLVLAALHDASAKVNALQSQAMGPMAGLDAGSMDLSDLGSLFGGAPGVLDVGALGDDDWDDDDLEDDDEDDGADGSGSGQG